MKRIMSRGHRTARLVASPAVVAADARIVYESVSLTSLKIG